MKANCPATLFQSVFETTVRRSRCLVAWLAGWSGFICVSAVTLPRANSIVCGAALLCALSMQLLPDVITELDKAISFGIRE
jgi:hypothetical protein